MSNEPENRVQDRRVTDTYRALANERTPDHLNERVLKLAADGRTPYARARAWMRPAAWAATIGLSFAIVLELTQLPTSDPDYPGISVTTDSDAPENGGARSDDVALPSRTLTHESPAPVAIEQDEIRTNAERKRAPAQGAHFQETLSKEEFVSRTESVMREAEVQAKARSGSDTGPDDTPAAATTEGESAEQMTTPLAAARRVAADRQTAKQVSEQARSAAASFAAAGDTAIAAQACPESERKTPDGWLACIKQLRESGENERADEEYEEFRRVFPEFDDSVTDK